MSESDDSSLKLVEEDDPFEVLYGPKPLPGTGHGTIFEEQRYLIFAETRKRDQSTCRMFTVHGPTAVAMASVYILDSQAKLPDKAPDDWEDTPGSGCNIIGWMFLMYF